MKLNITIDPDVHSPIITIGKHTYYPRLEDRGMTFLIGDGKYYTEIHPGKSSFIVIPKSLYDKLCEE
jgi:hypothetical protein